LFPQNGVMGNFSCAETQENSELADNVTLQESRLKTLPSSMSDSAIWRKSRGPHIDIEIECYFLTNS